MLVRRRTPSFARILLFFLVAGSAATLFSSLTVTPSDARMPAPLPWNWNDGQGDEVPFFTEPLTPGLESGEGESPRGALGTPARQPRGPAKSASPERDQSATDQFRVLLEFLAYRWSTHS